jgi:RNA polymerase sigma-70 factor (ECF subfamily)
MSPESERKDSQIATRAVSAAFRRYAPALHRYLLRRIRRSSEVADLSQEIFERFLRVQDSESVRHPQAYLFRIASHVVSDALTKEEHALVSFDSQAVQRADDSLEHASEDHATEIGLAQELDHAIAELSDMHRAVLLLAIRDGLSHREVATRTGLTVSTVGLYVCEARARIRMLLNRR